MKRLFTIILFFAIVYSVHDIFAQTLLEENFNYTVGDSLEAHGWVTYSGTNFPILVSSGSLSYPNYPSSGIGNSVNVIGSSGKEDDKKTFTTQSSGSVYASFLVNFSSATTATAGDYFLGFFTSTGVKARGRVFVKKSGSNIAFGLSKGSTTPTLSLFSYSLSTTYLLVLKYTFNAASSDDVVSLFINPNLSGSEPAPDLTNLDVATDLANVGAIFLRQGTHSYNLTIDGIRVATTWSQAPLPVELTSFTANLLDNSVVLNWETATEVNNYGFEIQRATGNLRGQGTRNGNSDLEGYQSIGFVQGNGNSNSPKSYSFTDNSVFSGKYDYRLKQIDTDGKYEYSDEVEVTIGVPDKIELSQNYPNPFNPSTQISFKLPFAAKINLSVFNVLGQKVYELENGFLEAGVHSIKFNAKSLASGIYFYRLSSSNIVLVNKMLLLK